MYMVGNKNILLVLPSLGLGGTEKTAQLFGSYLSDKGYLVYICSLYAGGQREKTFSQYAQGIHHANGDIDGIIDYIKKHHISIIHIHCSGICDDIQLKLLQYCDKNNIKTIVHSHFGLTDKQSDYICDSKIFVSYTLLSKFAYKYPKIYEENKHKYYVLGNPIDTNAMQQHILLSEEKNSLRLFLGIDSDDFVIGKVGRASLWKWDDTIIGVVQKLIVQGLKIKCIVRSVPEIKKKKILSLGLGSSFIFLPETIDEQSIAYTYQLMDIMIHTCRIGETFGVAILEAMHYGLPIITNNTPYNNPYILYDRDNAQSELVGKDNGLISNDIVEIVDYIVYLYTNRSIMKALSTGSCRKASSYNLSSLGDKLLGIYNQTIGPDLLCQENKKQNIYKESIYRSMVLNIIAIRDKFIYSAK